MSATLLPQLDNAGRHPTPPREDTTEENPKHTPSISGKVEGSPEEKVDDSARNRGGTLQTSWAEREGKGIDIRSSWAIYQPPPKPTRDNKPTATSVSRRRKLVRAPELPFKGLTSPASSLYVGDLKDVENDEEDEEDGEELHEDNREDDEDEDDDEDEEEGDEEEDGEEVEGEEHVGVAEYEEDVELPTTYLPTNRQRREYLGSLHQLILTNPAVNEKVMELRWAFENAGDFIDDLAVDFIEVQECRVLMEQRFFRRAKLDSRLVDGSKSWTHSEMEDSEVEDNNGRSWAYPGDFKDSDKVVVVEGEYENEEGSDEDEEDGSEEEDGSSSLSKSDPLDAEMSDDQKSSSRKRTRDDFEDSGIESEQQESSSPKKRRMSAEP
ncbi:hypothetical protein ABKN59_002095 [Abortiporus biennis]